MKLAVFIPLAFVVFESCSDSTRLRARPEGVDEPNGSGSQELVDVKLKAASGTGNIFELMSFSLAFEEPCTYHEMRESYDSIVWKVPGIGSRPIFTYSGNSLSLTLSWSHNFFLPGEYEVRLLGYKDKKIVLTETVPVRINNGRDFLGYNWDEITESSKGSTGYVDELSGSYELATYHSYGQGMPSATLFIWPGGEFFNKMTEHDFYRESKEILFNFINGLYSDYAYGEEDGALLTEKYESLFENKGENASPLYIWLTHKSRIVLLEYYDEWADDYIYRVYSEPNT